MARLAVPNAGYWFDPGIGKLVVAVVDQASAAQVRAGGAEAVVVARGQAELDRLLADFGGLRPQDATGVYGWGIDPQVNGLVIRMSHANDQFVAQARRIDPNLRVVNAASAPRQQSGDVRPGSPWWPGSETYCSIGFPATDSAGGKHFVTAGHCTNDVSQPAYGEISQRNRIGTSNSGGGRSVNAREGDMGVVAVTESGWNLSAAVNTWDKPPVTVTGSTEPVQGMSVCHSGNTSKWQCGRVTAINQTINYGSVVVEGLTTTTACSLGGDSGGAWLAGDKAVGLHSGGQSSCSPGGADDQSIFQPVNEPLRKWGLTLVVGSGGDSEAPTVPGSLRSTGGTSDSVSLAWDASTDNVGVAGYDVYNGSAFAVASASPSATVTGLAADTSYTFTVRARDAAGNQSAASAAVTVRTQSGGGGGRTFSNDTDYQIRDFTVASSRLTSNATNAAANPATVKVTATHTCYEDLTITLVAPSGRWYTLARGGGFQCTAFGGPRTYQVPLNERASGTWTLRVADNGPGDVGVLDSWSVTL
ncbi:chitinase [Kibdelosporangium phytohabitans]|uniref:Chitinase n=1 Tax=Kibdelosporangium phytohabitans TaxID=860235 RepID=A0A0N9HLN2_9PSEU|nr:chitinase [Kibdelosporangium phytohabitans]